MTDLSDPSVRERLRALAGAVTALPWVMGRMPEWEETTVVSAVARDDPDEDLGDPLPVAVVDASEVEDINRAYIVAACNALPPALDLIDNLIAENDQLRDAVKVASEIALSSVEFIEGQTITGDGTGTALLPFRDGPIEHDPSPIEQGSGGVSDVMRAYGPIEQENA